MRLLKSLSISFVSVAALAAAGPALAQSKAKSQSGIPVGRTPAPAPTPAPIPVQPTAAPTTTVAQALSAQTDHTMLVKLIDAAGLSPVLSGAGPVTIFAPDDAAFGRLGGAVQQLLDPANVSSAKQIAKYHIVQGSYPAKELLAQLKAKGGTMTLNTLDNQPLTLTLQGESAIELTDAKGGKAYVSKLSDEESNGVIEYINGVLSPNMVAQPPAPAAPGATTTTPAPDAAATPTDDTGAADSGDQDDDSSAS